MKKKDDDNETDDDGFFQQIVLKSLDGSVNQHRAVIAGNDFDAGRE